MDKIQPKGNPSPNFGVNECSKTHLKPPPKIALIRHGDQLLPWSQCKGISLTSSPTINQSFQQNQYLNSRNQWTEILSNWSLKKTQKKLLQHLKPSPPFCLVDPYRVPYCKFWRKWPCHPCLLIIFKKSSSIKRKLYHHFFSGEFKFQSWSQSVIDFWPKSTASKAAEVVATKRRFRQREDLTLRKNGWSVFAWTVGGWWNGRYTKVLIGVDYI